MSLLSFLRRLDGKRRHRRKRPEMVAFQEAIDRLAPGDIAIDCGANVGIYTKLMAESGATVYAFEPNRAAYEELLSRTSHYPHVKAIHAAVTTEPGEVKLYLHKWADDDPVHWSTGSSLIAAKKNVRSDRFTVVEGVPLAEFIKGLDGRVRILKMDIEGAEVGILNQLLDEGLQASIDQAFVEVHARKVRELVEPTETLRERLREMGVTHFCLDWR